MSSEKLALALNEASVCEPNASVSSTVITKRNQQVYTQHITTSRIRKINSSIDNENLTENLNLVPMSETSLVQLSDSKNAHVDVKRTTKTYCRRIIRKIGPNGEVSEEIIEEGDPISRDFFPPSQNAIENNQFPSLTASSDEESSKPKGFGAAKFQATAEFQSVSETGEKRSLQLSTGPLGFQFNNSENKILALENNESKNDETDTTDMSRQLSLINNPSNSIQQVLPDGTIVTRKFYGEKTATVTHSSTINGQTQTSSQSAFVSFSGESMLEATSINEIEGVFGQMMKGMNFDSFDVFNRFLDFNKNSMVDHLALAGGDMKTSLLALEGPEPTESSGFHLFKNKSISSKTVSPPDTIHENSAKTGVTKDQQEEALIQQQIKAIKDSKASNRLYWSNMEEVKSSGILAKMKKEEIHLQEAIFEIITSEASYNISLDTVIEYYYNSEQLDPNKTDAIITATLKHHLFSNILLVKTVSLNLLKDLENRWSEQKPKITDLADIILKHTEDDNFQKQYINYLTNQSYQINALKTLLQKENFKQALITIQNNPQCCKLSLDSFLALPMQRLTRLKLLTEVVLKLMHQSEELLKIIPDYALENNKKALSKLKELLTTSENNKYKMEQKARLIDLSKFLEFTGPCKYIAIGSKELIKEGEVRAAATQINPSALKKLSKKRQPCFYLIALSDLIIITKKKSSSRFVVLDYCERDKVDVFPYDSTACNTGSKFSRVSVASLTSISSVDSLSQTVVGHSFVLQFSKESTVTDLLVFTVPTIESRDQWISAISSKE